MSDEPSYELVMPFVSVVSKGGPFDDAAYVAGWEMGALDHQLGAARARVETTIQTANAPQADLIAMKNGYAIEATEAEGAPDWTHLVLTPHDDPQESAR